MQSEVVTCPYAKAGNSPNRQGQDRCGHENIDYNLTTWYKEYVVYRFAILFFALVMVGCAPTVNIQEYDSKPVESVFESDWPVTECHREIITNVHSVRQTSEGAWVRYTFTQIDEKTKEAKVVNLADSKVKVFVDVPKDKPIWAEMYQQPVYKDKSKTDQLIRQVIFHIRSMDDLK